MCTILWLMCCSQQGNDQVSHRCTTSVQGIAKQASSKRTCRQAGRQAGMRTWPDRMSQSLQLWS